MPTRLKHGWRVRYSLPAAGSRWQASTLFPPTRFLTQEVTTTDPNVDRLRSPHFSLSACSLVRAIVRPPSLLSILQLEICYVRGLHLLVLLLTSLFSVPASNYKACSCLFLSKRVQTVARAVAPIVGNQVRLGQILFDLQLATTWVRQLCKGYTNGRGNSRKPPGSDVQWPKVVGWPCERHAIIASTTGHLSDGTLRLFTTGHRPHRFALIEWP